MRLLLFAAAALVASYLVDAEAADDAPGEEIVLADRVRAAFYDVAPRRLAASMRRAVESSCTTRLAAAGATTAAHRWLCDGTKLSFLREVDVLGNRLKIGFVCKREWARLAYYVDDLVAGAIDDAMCVTVWFNSEASAHFLDFGDSNE